MKKLSATYFDDLVIGSGLTGLLISSKLAGAGRRVALLEQKDYLGGQYRPASSSQGLDLPVGLNLLPFGLSKDRLENWLSLIGLKVELRPKQMSAKTFSQGELKSFVGFGGETFKSVDILSQLNNLEWQELLPPASQIVSHLVENAQFKIENLHPVTQIAQTEGNGYLVSTDGGHLFESERIFFTGSPKDLPGLLSQELKVKGLHRFAKIDGFTQLSLHWAHKPEPVEAEEHLYFLYGSSGEYEPLVGRFFGHHQEADGSKLSCSYWFQLISWEQAQETEFVGQSVKYMKKQIKRAFPQLEQNLQFERITLSPAASLNWPAKTLDQLQLPEGLFLASHLQSSFFGEASHFDIAMKVTNEAEKSVLIAKDSQLAPSEASC